MDAERRRLRLHSARGARRLFDEIFGLARPSGIDTSSFVGTGYQLSGGTFANEIIPVPEPETYATALLLLLGLSLYFHRQRKAAPEKGVSQKFVTLF